MSEVLLEALMQLFALLTDVKHTSADTGRAKVGEYLSRQFNAEYVRKFVQRYDLYVSLFHSKATDDDDDVVARQQYEDNLLKLSAICQAVNREVDLEGKVLLMSSMLNYVAKPDLSEAEERFVDGLADHMRIPADDFWNLKAFTLQGPNYVVDKGRLLLINGHPEKGHPDVKHIYIPKFGVDVWVLHIRCTNTFVFRYEGERNLYLSGHKLDADKVYPMAPGGVINTSHVRPVYYGHIAEKFITKTDCGRIIYKAVDVEYKFSDGNVGIHKFSFLGRGGQLVGIMGGSGSGKSTLMNLLCGNLKMSNGQITINGYDISSDCQQLEGVIGYVPQDDMLNEELTVYENLWFNAKLIFSNKTRKEKVALVEKALADFDLVEARDLKVGSPLNKVLSGGQRKRLNIALELMREPSVLFVDEPTSGLSSIDSEKVMTLLKRQVLKGKLVIINIHQPNSDIYKLLDKLLIIDHGGHMTYNGNPMNAIVYFKKKAHYVNPEERECYLCGNVKTEQPLRIIESRMVDTSGKLIRKRKVTPAEWYKAYTDEFEASFDWKSKRITQKEKLPENLYSIPNRRSQFLTFIQRDALKKLKDTQYMLINILEVPVLAILLALATRYVGDSGIYNLFENSNLPTYLFMSVVVALFVGLNVSAEEMFKDRKLLVREQFLNLSRTSYLMAKVINLLGMVFLQTLLLVGVGDSIMGVGEMWFSHTIVLFSAFAFAVMLGLNISSGLKTAVSIYVCIPLILVPQLLFSGTMVNFDRLHPALGCREFTPVLGDLHVSRWAYEAMAVEQYAHNAYERNFFDIEMDRSRASYASATWLPELSNLNEACRKSLLAGQGDEVEVKYQLLRNELCKVCEQSNVRIATLPNTYSEGAYGIVRDAIAKAKTVNQDCYQRATMRCDSISRSLVEKLGGADALASFKRNHTNEALSRLVQNKDNFAQISVYDDLMVRRRQPIYAMPTNVAGRAQFYSPFKRLGGWTIPTLWFNCVVIWLAVLVLYVTLYFDILRRVLLRIESFKQMRLNKRIEKLRGLV